MAIEFREYLGATFNEHKDHPSFGSINLSESTHYSNRVAPNSLMVDIEGLHSVVTRNDTFYTDEAMKKSEKYWTSPYERPVIMHHNEADGITIGRVKRAYWTDVNTRSKTGALRFITNIGTKEGIEGINNGSLSTVSIGVIAYEVRCSICNQDIATEGECEHDRGGTYDGKRCYWIINEFEPKELSFVIVPSDPYAHILKVSKPTKQDLQESIKNTKEVNNMFENPFMDLIEEADKTITDLTEATSKKEETKKQEEETEETKKAEEKNNESTAEENKKEEQSKEDDKQEQKQEETEDKGHTKSESNSNVEEEKTKESSDKKEEESEEQKEEENTENNTSEEQEESKEEDTVKGKTIEEEVKRDIESKNDNIYKDIEKKLQDAEAENKNFKQEITDLKKEMATLKANLQTEKSLKESAEAELIVFRTEKKRSLAEQVNSLRTSLNLSEKNMEDLMEASEDTLNFTIKDLKEFNTKIADLNSIPKTQSEVAISEKKDNTQKTSTIDVKENKVESNINLEESVIDILSKAFGNGL